MTKYGDILWRPTAERSRASFMGRFAAAASVKTGRALESYPALHEWSVTDLAAFWGEIASFTGVEWQKPADSVYVPPKAGHMLGARWFSGARLNYAENLLGGPDRPDAVIALAEGAPRRCLSLAELRSEVSRCAAALKKAGVGKGDRVAGVVGNLPEALIAMLATSALGGVWASCSPDFGAAAVADRLGQIDPKVVFFTSSYIYNGKRFDCGKAIREALALMPGTRRGVLIQHLPGPSASGDFGPARLESWGEFLATSGGDPGHQLPLAFAPLAFDEPLFILFSSGTTGVPKCIVHGVGGTLLQHKKELLLHSDVGPGSRLFFYTTCGWMMWNWMVTGLSTGASLVLFEGSVASPDLGALWRVVRDEGVTAFGASPKFVASCMSQGISPKALLGGYAPRTLLLTGAPLLPEHFAWLYEQVPGKDGDLHVASISGGTDIVSCFMLGTPLLPVRAGEIQAPGLGMAIDAWDERGESVRGEKAELVCTRPFVAMPVGFWRDEGGARYRKAYFEHYLPLGREVWRHGDYVELTPSGGVVVYGRSDATLNPGGVRIGTAEIYRQVEALPEVVDSLAVGRRAAGGDTDIILFVKLRAGVTLDAALKERLRGAIRSGLTPRHLPKEIAQVQDIPYTRSGKKVELAVTNAIHGEPVTNAAALANPESLAEYVAFGLNRGGAK